ncbi:MAG: glycoside hydrolase [Bacteroidales bacterium]|nr:glycoside hydrolase [Bacteroidales bacterium]
MKKYYYVVSLIILVFVCNEIYAQGNQKNFQGKNQPFEVDKRIDNMGYWMKMAEDGFIPYNPVVPVKPAKFKGTQFIIKSVPQDSPDIPVTSAGNTTQSENSIFVDPMDNEHVLNSNNSTDWNGSTVSGLYGADYFYTNNAGDTWGGSISGAGGSNSGDPAAVIGRNGRRFIGSIYNQGQAVAYSDNDINWTRVVAGTVATWWPLNMLDKNHLWIDNSPSSSYEGNLYSGWTRFELFSSDDGHVQISRSANNGASWASPINVSNSLPAPNDLNQGVNISTGPNGEVYAVWAVYENTSVLDENAIGFNKSVNGGDSFGSAFKIITGIKGIRTVGVSKNMRVNSFPSMSVDISGGANNGNIYVVWTNVGTPGINTGTNKSVYIIKSSNGGTTWSTPIKVNQDPFQNGKEAYFPWISCDPVTGFLYVIFYDDRNTSSSSCETWVAISEDAGDTWDDFRVSDVSFTPSPIPGLAADYFGDYLGISANNGWVYPCWTDNRNGNTLTYISPFQYPIRIDLDLTVFLEGPFNGTNMNASLNSVLPFSQPFNTTPWNYSGTENVTSIPGNDIVDWVLIDIRDAASADLATPITRIGRHAAFLRNDGKVVDMEGNPVLSFSASVSEGLFVIVYQRNHIPVISGTSLIESGGIYTFDFSTNEGQAFGGAIAHKEVMPGIWAMFSGDGDADGLINLNDKNNVWIGEATTKGYIYGDFNLDIQVDNKDKNENWQPNNGMGSQVPD